MVQSYFEDQLYMSEPAFVARPGGTEEDDGVLVAAAIRGKINKIFFLSKCFKYFNEFSWKFKNKLCFEK